MPSLANSPFRPGDSRVSKPRRRPADVFRQINDARTAHSRDLIDAAYKAGAKSIDDVATMTGLSRSTVKRHRMLLGLSRNKKGRPTVAARKAKDAEARLLAEFHDMLATYERRRARGVIDADLADDIAWMMEAELKIGVYDRHGVRYRVIAEELVRDGNYRPAPRICAGTVKTEDEREARRAA